MIVLTIKGGNRRHMSLNMDLEKSPNTDLLAANATTNPDAFAEIYDLYFPRVYNYIKFRVGDPYLTDDLTSQVFEKVLNRIDTYNQYRGSFTAWLFTIAHNIVVDHLRKQKNTPLIFLDGDNTKGPNPKVEDAIIAKELRDNLFLALHQLGDRERNILGLKFWSRLTNRKIAELTGLSENNVGIIIYRVMRRLRVVLRDLGVNSYE